MQSKHSMARGFRLGLFVSIFGAACYFMVSQMADVLARGGKPAWLEPARATTMANKRSFTLPLNNPSTVSVEKADHMRPDDMVVGVKVRGRARAYPWWILANYHVVNDTIGRHPLYIGLCELCSGASVFLPVIKELPRRPLIFQISGQAVGTFEISDVQTRSRWHPFSGIAKAGPLKGRRLEKIPSVMTSWSEWIAMQPDTDVVLAGEHLRYHTHSVGHHEIAAPDWMNYEVVEDDRLASNAMVYGLTGQAEREGLAFELDALRRVSLLQVDFEQRPILIFADGDYRAMAYYRSHGDEVLKLEFVGGSEPMFRDQFGNEWNRWGTAVDGPHAGAQLEPVRGYLTEWYEWVSGTPDTDIFEFEAR